MYSRLAPRFLYSTDYSDSRRISSTSRLGRLILSRFPRLVSTSIANHSLFCGSSSVVALLCFTRCVSLISHIICSTHHTSIDAQRRTQIASLATKTAKEIKQKRGPKVPSEHKTKCQTRIEEM